MSTYLYYRRGSVFWALILIAVGGLFLYQNFNPSIRPWEILAKFWPVVIIFWGVSKLIDYFQYRAHPEISPPSLFSGGEAVLLILVLIMGTLVSHIVLHHWPQGWSKLQGANSNWEDLFGNSYTYTQSLSVPAGAQPHLLVVNHRGDVEIRGASASGFEAVIKEVVHAGSDQEAAQLADRIKFQIVQQGGEYVLQSNLDSLPGGGRNVRLDMTLSVPAATSAELTLESGNLNLEGLHGEQNLTVNHGDARVSQVEGLVRLRKSGGDTSVSNVKGDVEIQGRGGDTQVSNVSGTATVNGEYTGDTQASNIGQTFRFLSSRTDLTVQNLAGSFAMDSGDLRASGISGPFDLITRAKDINLDGFSHSVKISNTNGDIDLRASAAPTHPIEVQLAKGDIQLTLPAESNFQISAVSHHGEVECDFSGPNLKMNKSGEDRYITGSYGTAGPAIRLSTNYGTIHLSHGGPVPPKPPTPPTPPSSRT